MNRYLTLLLTVPTLLGWLVALSLFESTADSAAMTGTRSDTPDIVLRMIEAHGGMEAWRNAEVVQFTHISFMPSMPDHFPRWMISHETIEQKTRRAYADHPHWNAEVAFDGEKVTSSNWIFPNPPEQMIAIHYYMVFLPWLSQDPGIEWSSPESAVLPGSGEEVTGVSFWYARSEEDEKPDVWSLFIDPETYDLRAFGLEFAQGKATHVVRGTSNAGPLRVPSDWTTYIAPDNRVIGHHAVVDVSLDAEFDELRVR